MNDIVAVACRLVGAGNGVRGVHIVANGRPTHAELRTYRETALSRHARLTVDGAGVITVRPNGREEEIA